LTLITLWARWRSGSLGPCSALVLSSMDASWRFSSLVWLDDLVTTHSLVLGARAVLANLTFVDVSYSKSLAIWPSQSGLPVVKLKAGQAEVAVNSSSASLLARWTDQTINKFVAWLYI
jgi:hypothetical protein